MGYRLEIQRIKPSEYYGTKLYGYSVDLEKLKSYQLLKQLGKVDGTEYWSYGFKGNIILNAKEFKQFIKLYDEDLFNNPIYRQMEKNEFINLPEIQKLLKSKEDKLLNWN